LSIVVLKIEEELPLGLNRILMAASLGCIAIAVQAQTQNAAVPNPVSVSAPQASAVAPKTSYGPIAVPEIAHGILAGYLDARVLPNSLALIEPKPVPGSSIALLDDAVSKANLALRGSKRWDLASMDADLSFPNVAGTYSCSAGIPITETDTPHLYILLRRSMTDAGLATYAAKNTYKRTRPFMENNQPTCAPDQEASLRTDGSYPSGHTAIGWAWALILTEVAPAQANAVLARGRAFGDSRLVCNVHWQSDVTEGRVVGASAVARLHADPSFEADLEAAKMEYAVAAAKGLKPTRDCAAEAAALSTPVTAVH
jgi:acid phosphatase (class A)